MSLGAQRLRDPPPPRAAACKRPRSRPREGCHPRPPPATTTRMDGRSRRGVVVPRHAEAPPHEHREDRHLHLGEAPPSSHAPCGSSRQLVFQTHRKPGIVDRFRPADGTRSHRSRCRVSLSHPSAVIAPPLAVLTVRGDDAHRVAVEPSEAGHLVRAPQRPDLEERVRSAISAMPLRMSNVVVRFRGIRVNKRLLPPARWVLGSGLAPGGAS